MEGVFFWGGKGDHVVFRLKGREGESLEYWKELGVEGNQVHFIFTHPKSPAPPPPSPWRFVMTVP